MYNGREVASLLFAGLIVLLCFLALNVNAATNSGDISDAIVVSETAPVHKCPPLLETLTLSEALVVRKFTPILESIPISEAVSVTIYRLNRADVSANLSLGEVLLARKFTPSSEDMLISEALGVAVYRLNQGGASDSLAVSDVLSIVVNGVHVMTASEAFAVSDGITSEKKPAPKVVTRRPRRVHVGLTEKLAVSDESGERREVQILEELPLHEEGKLLKRPLAPTVALPWKVIGGTLGASILVVVILTFLRRRGKGSPRLT